MSSSSNVLETALISCVAAAVGSYVAITLLRPFPPPPPPHHHYHPHPPPPPYETEDHPSHHPFSATFLENGRTNGTDHHHEDPSSSHTKGWSMEDALQSAKEGCDKVKQLSPNQVLAKLQKGNSRFFSGRARRPEISAFERRALIKQQFPSTAVLGCADSRVPVEIVFDQGLGDMFVVRVAGNCLGPTTQASLEYAIHHLQVKLVMVMGHEGCGAIKAANLSKDYIRTESPSLSKVLFRLKSGLRKSDHSTHHLDQILDRRARDREAVVTNVRIQIEDLTKDPQVLKQVNEGKLIIIGAFYEISSGIVDFFMEVSQYQKGDEFKPSPGVESRYNPDTEEIVYS